MQRTERAWDSITDAYGRDNQLRVWKAFRQQYPGVRSAALQRIGF